MERKIYFFLLLFCVSCLTLLTKVQAQTSSSVTGVVRDEKQQPVPGTSVMLKGTTTGVVTDVNGHFQINAPSNGTLVFKNVSYQTIEIAIKGKSVLEVQLSVSNQSLNEVVVLAYGSQSKRNITGAVQTINGTQLQDQAAGQITQKLQGQLAGVQITQTSGDLGAGVVVRIRGAASISAGNSPLYVIDGMPILGDLSNINPDEIETHLGTKRCCIYIDLRLKGS